MNRYLHITLWTLGIGIVLYIIYYLYKNRSKVPYINLGSSNPLIPPQDIPNSNAG